MNPDPFRTAWRSVCFAGSTIGPATSFPKACVLAIRTRKEKNKSLYKMLVGAASPQWYGRCSPGEGEDGAGCGHPAPLCIPLAAPRRLVPVGERHEPRVRAWGGESGKRAKAYFPPKLIFWALPFAAAGRTLTVRVLQLSHGGHKRLLRHMAG